MSLETKAGEELALGEFAVAWGPVEAYLQAVGDELPVYRESGFAPPLYCAATALGLLLDRLGLPPGAIHSIQEVETLSPVRIGEALRVSVHMERPRQRGGIEFMTAVCTIADSAGAPAIISKSTVMAPPESSGASRAGGPEVDQTPANQIVESELPVVTRTIGQPQLNAYAKASGDSNPLHLDADFAAGTQFGGIIAHGMLTLALVSQMMAARFGETWLETGALRVRFKGAAYVGDRIQTWGKHSKTVTRDAGSSSVSVGTFSVGVTTSDTGREIITGSAYITQA